MTTEIVFFVTLVSLIAMLLMLELHHRSCKKEESKRNGSLLLYKAIACKIIVWTEEGMIKIHELLKPQIRVVHSRSVFYTAKVFYLVKRKVEHIINYLEGRVHIKRGETISSFLKDIGEQRKSGI